MDFFIHKLLSIIDLDKMNILNDLPSMNNIYDSDYYTKTRQYEQSLSDDFYKKAQMPFKTGVVPHYINGDDTNINSKVIKSLSGNDINVSDFKHGNMQPFLRKGVTQNVDKFDGMLQKNMGYNNINVKKQEVDNFFVPQPDVLNTTYDSEFLLSRTELSKIQNNYAPIQSVRVGPGLNKGYTNEGTGGFQQNDTRDFIKPKSKEELRPLSDQRNSTYNLPMKPKNNVEQRGVVMPLDKNRPDTTFTYTEDNWFKGQSALKKETERPLENITDTSAKENTHIDYYGSLKYQDEYISNNDDYGKNTIIVYDNERNHTQKETPVANFSSVIKAMISPITDAIKITAKEYFIDNPRLNGNAAPQIPDKATTYDPVTHSMKTTVKETTIHEGNNGTLTGADETYSALYDNAKTTVKETTIHEGNNGTLTGADETYSALYDTTKTTVKETTIHEGNNGNLTGADESYSALYDTTKTTVKETTIHEGNGGYMEGKQLGYVYKSDKTRTTMKETLPKQDTIRNINNTTYYSTYVYDPSIVAKTTLKETTLGLGGSQYGFLGGLLNSLFGGYLIKNDEAKNTQRQYSLTENYGIAGSKTAFIPTDREADYNAEIDGTREMIMINAGYTPGAGGKYVGLPKEEVNMNVNKRQIDLEESERIGTMGTVYEGLPIPLSNENITKDPMRNNAYNNRLDSSILSSLIENEDIIKINPIRLDCDPI